MANRLEVIKVPNESTERRLSGLINQFFAQNPAITIRIMSLLFNEKSGQQLYQFSVAYESIAGATYSAKEFESVAGGTSADFQLEDYVLNNPDLQPIKVWDITSTEARTRTGLTRYLVIFIDTKTAYRLAMPGYSVPSQAAQDIASTASNLFKQTNGWIPATSDQFTARNAGGGTWVSQAEGIITQDASGGGAGVSCCGASGTDDTGSAVTPPEGQSCDGDGPPDFPPPPPPVGGGTCCLRYDYECQCIDDVDTWVRISLDCVNNALCDVFQETCAPDAAHFEAQNWCVCGGDLPDFVPDPDCDPICCDPPAFEDCCLNAVFNCNCSSGVSEWVTTTLECIANDECNGGEEIYKEDTDGDGNIDQISYSSQGACECGESDQSVLAALLPAPDFVDGEPAEDPECCEGTCCLTLRYYCVEEGGASVWEFAGAECVDNDDCTSSGAGTETPVDTCTGGSTYEVTLRDGCECNDKGVVSQASAEAELPGYPKDCEASCAERVCVYTWESEYDCDTDTWGAVILDSSACLVGASETGWAITEDCIAQRTTVSTTKCTNGDSCPTPDETPDGPDFTPDCCACNDWVAGNDTGNTDDSFTIALPADACEGTVDLTVVPDLYSANEGFSFVVSTPEHGVLANTGCITTGTTPVAIPAGASQIDVVVTDCDAYINDTWDVSWSSP